MLAIRRAERYLQTVRELSGESYWSQQYEWLKSFSKKDDLKNKIEILADLLEVARRQLASKADVAFRMWRTKFEEKLGIFVFQFPMPENELDGFSYAFDEFPYAIVVNNQNAAVRKIFTLFHELAHILKHDPGACKPNLATGSQLDIELECNNFSGKFLIPIDHLRATDSVDEIFKLAGLLNVSGEAYLRRLDEEGKISKNLFFELLSSDSGTIKQFRQAENEGHAFDDNSEQKHERN